MIILLWPKLAWTFYNHGRPHVMVHSTLDCVNITRLPVWDFFRCGLLLSSAHRAFYMICSKLTLWTSWLNSHQQDVTFELFLKGYQFFFHSFMWPLLLSAALSFEDGWLELEQHSVTMKGVKFTDFHGRTLSASWTLSILMKIISTQRLAPNPPLHLPSPAPTQNHLGFQKPMRGLSFWTQYH